MTLTRIYRKLITVSYDILSADNLRFRSQNELLFSYYQLVEHSNAALFSELTLIRTISFIICRMSYWGRVLVKE